MPRNPTLVSCLALAVLAGCSRGGAPVPAAAAAPAAAPLAPAALLYYDNGGGIQDSLRRVIRDAEEYRQLWTRATSTQSSPPPAAEIDFRRYMVLLVSNGRMTPEDVIRVDSVGVRQEVSPSGSRARVMGAIVRTIRGCGGFNADAYPLAIVRVERFEGEVRFDERRERAEGCPGAAAPSVSGVLAAGARR